MGQVKWAYKPSKRVPVQSPYIQIGREKLVEAVRTVAAGEELFAPTVLRRLVTHYAISQPLCTQASAPAEYPGSMLMPNPP